MSTRGRISSCLLGITFLLWGGCVSDVPEHVEWDLSDSHLPADVDWEPRSDMDGAVIESIESVRIELPGGHVFEADSDIHDVTLGNEGESLTLVAVEFQPESVDDAYKRALAFAEEWDMSTESLDRWHKRVSDPDDDLTTTGLTQRQDSLDGPDGPWIVVQLRPISPETPALVSFQIQWLK